MNQYKENVLLLKMPKSWDIVKKLTVSSTTGKFQRSLEKARLSHSWSNHTQMKLGFLFGGGWCLDHVQLCQGILLAVCLVITSGSVWGTIANAKIKPGHPHARQALLMQLSSQLLNLLYQRPQAGLHFNCRQGSFSLSIASESVDKRTRSHL